MDKAPHVRVPQAHLLSGLDSAALGSDIADRLQRYGQSVTEAVTDWNNECSRFGSHRLSRIAELTSEMAKCQTPAELAAVHAKWLQFALHDYTQEFARLLEINSKILGSLMGSGNQVASSGPSSKVNVK